jgi:hypothetical protein
VGSRGKANNTALKRPARLTAAFAEWLDSQEPGTSDDDAHDDLGTPARLTAGLAEWVGLQDDRELRKAFRRVGLEVFERKPEHHYVHEYYGRGARKLRSGLDDEEFFPLAREVWDQERTYLYYNRLYTLYQAVRNVARQFPSGELTFLEAGVYQGGSTYFLARAAQRYAGDRVSLLAVDTFEGHSEEDLPTGQEGAHTLDKFKETSVEEVREYLSPFQFVEVVQGRIQEVAPRLEGDVHLIHLDVDIYAPTRFGLEFASERLRAGGMAIVDDYGFTTCPGVKQAVDEVIEGHAETFVLHTLDSGQALVLRTH